MGNGFRGRFGGLSPDRKVLTGAVAVACVISLAVFGLWLGHEDNAVLFSNLSASDAGLVLDELARWDVPAELASGGTAVLVPESLVHRLRVEMAARGIPSSGTVGFEIHDGRQSGQTAFLQGVDDKRALEGELTRSIESLQGIRSARVHLVTPGGSLRDPVAGGAGASVVLDIGPEAGMSPSQIAGIRNLVAGSVANLEAEQVTVIDQRGKILSGGIRDDLTGGTDGQLALRKQVETYLAGKAGSMLDQVLGPGRSVVQVDAVLNFGKIDTRRETYDPRGRVVRSEVRKETTDPDSGTTDENQTADYEINRTVEHVVEQPGGIEKLSVAVFVDGTYERPAGSGRPVYQPLTEDELGQLRRIVQTAVGLDAVRGDRIEVVNMPFHQGAAGAGSPVWTDWPGLVARYGGKAFLLVVFVVMAFSLRRTLGRWLAAVPGPGVRDADRPRPVDAGASSDGIPDMDDQMMGDIRAYASEHPDRVANVVNMWVQEMEKGRIDPEPAGGTRD